MRRWRWAILATGIVLLGVIVLEVRKNDGLELPPLVSSDPNKDRADRLARRLGVVIPGSIPIALWSLPILEVIVERVERCERSQGFAIDPRPGQLGASSGTAARP